MLDLDERFERAAIALDRQIGVPQWQPVEEFRRRARRRRNSWTAITAAGVLALTTAVVTGRDTGIVERATLAESAPGWYRAFAPMLPPDFRHVAIRSSNDHFAIFEAFDSTSGRTLIVTISRRSHPPDPSGAITLEQAMNGEWSDVGTDLNVSLPDGRQVEVACECPDTERDIVDPDTILSTAITLATEFSPTDLPPPMDLMVSVPTSLIRAAADEDGDALGEIISLGAPHDGFSFVQYGDDLIVSTTTGFFPPLPPDTPRGQLVSRDRRETWQVVGSNTVWTVRTTLASSPDIANRILDRAAALQPPTPS